MTESPSRCVACGAIGGADDVCWLCGREVVPLAEMAGGGEVVNPYQAPTTAASTTSAAAVSVPLILTVVVVSVGLALAAPGFGIPIAVVVTPALIRTIVQVGTRESSGADVSTGRTAKLFLASLAGTVTACVTAGVAFFATCAAGCFGVLALDAKFTINDSVAFAILFGGGGIAGLTCGALVLKRMWRTRR